MQTIANPHINPFHTLHKLSSWCFAAKPLQQNIMVINEKEVNMFSPLSVIYCLSSCNESTVKKKFILIGKTWNEHEISQANQSPSQPGCVTTILCEQNTLYIVRVNVLCFFNSSLFRKIVLSIFQRKESSILQNFEGNESSLHRNFEILSQFFAALSTLNIALHNTKSCSKFHENN